MKWNLYREVPLCFSKWNVRTHKLRKVYCLKRLWSERNDWIWLHLFIKDDTRPSWHIVRPTSRYLTSWGAKQATVTWIVDWLRAWPVLFSLPGSVMGRESVYLRDFSEVLQSLWDRNANESRKRYPSTDWLGPRRRIQDVSLQISVTNCVPLRGYTINFWEP